jgi:tetratricopeptide (TPR) repeat protein
VTRSFAVLSLAALSLATLCGCPIQVPDIARQYNDECVRLYSEKDLAQAEVACDHALEYQPRYWDALHNKGLVRLAQNDRAAAKSLFMNALRANQDMAQSYSMLGLLALEDREFKVAKDFFNAALRLQPEFVQARNNLGVACLRSDDLDGAEKAFRHQILSAPSLSEPYALLGEVMLRRQKPADAIEWFRKAVALEANYAAAWKGLGVAYAALGKRDEAKDAFESCVDSNPEELECRAALKQLVQ